MKDMYYGAFAAANEDGVLQTGLTKLEYASIEMMKTLLLKSDDLPGYRFDQAMMLTAKQATTIATILMEETAQLEHGAKVADAARRRAEIESVPPGPVLDF